MRRVSVTGLVVIGLIVGIVRPVRAQITPQQVQGAIDRACRYLREQQNRVTGGWTEHGNYSGAVTALSILALLNAGDSPGDPHIQSALNYLRKLDKPTTTYAASLQTMAFCAATPNKDRLLIRRNVRLMESWQLRSGPRKGAWTYTAPKTENTGDNSNSQFAVLALHEAERMGVEVSDQTWSLALQYWTRTQKADGSWGYLGKVPGTGSMTCAGITSVVISAARLSQGDARVAGGRVQCCAEHQDDESYQRGLQWLGRHFTVHRNPSSQGGQHKRSWVLYYLYGVERVGRMTGQRFVGGHDWYREGAKMLISVQDKLSGYWKGAGHAENNPTIATAMALLFLSKGRRPVVIAKLDYGAGGDWNRHRSDIANLTHDVERRWRRDMSWQIIDSHSATASDLLQTPVLLITGSGRLVLFEPEKKNLRAFVEQGGFLFACATCKGDQFSHDFRALMEELFPETPLRLLPYDHPIWYAETKVDPRFMPELWGIDACCRTSVVFCPEDLSCYWELSRSGRQQEYPAAVKAKIDAYLGIGANVLAYATGRELKDKLDVPNINTSELTEQPGSRGVLYIAKLQHAGGSDDAPSALTNLLRAVHQHSRMRVSTERRLLAIGDDMLLDHPVVFMHGRRQFQLTQTEQRALRTYVERGGVILADSICASDLFTSSFRRQMRAIFPDRPLQRIPTDHPMFQPDYSGFDVTSVTRRDPQQRAGGDDPLRVRLVETVPLLEGIKIDDRYGVIFSPFDISCALENTPSLECKGYTTKDAARIGVNMILYALAQ